jgi:hypothetical protein
LQGSRGQSTVEWLGVCAAVVVLVALIAGRLAPVASAVTTTFRQAICAVGVTSCPGGSSPSPGQPRDLPFKALDPSAPTSGPAIGTRPRNVGADLPFPGSVSVTVDPKKKGSTNADPDFTGPKAGYTVGVTAKYERTTSPCSIDGTGTPTVTLSTSADIKVEVGADGKAKGYGAGITGSIGTSTGYDVKTDPANADRIDHGDVPPPNPVDPRSIPEGSSIVLNRDSYRGADGSIAYRNITAELGYKEGRRVSSAVQRVGADTVRVTVGDTDFVENSLGLKVGDENVAAGVKIGNGFLDGKARSVDLDIGTPEGWAAYQSFITSGRLPAQGASGTSNATTSTSATSTHTDTITGKLGPFGGTSGGTTVQGQIVETVKEDGSKVTTAFSRRGDTVVATEYDRDPSGKIVGEHYALHLQDVDKNYVDGYQQLTGQQRRERLQPRPHAHLRRRRPQRDAERGAGPDPRRAARQRRKPVRERRQPSGAQGLSRRAPLWRGPGAVRRRQGPGHPHRHGRGEGALRRAGRAAQQRPGERVGRGRVPHELPLRDAAGAPYAR